nr:PREDICTED: general transcription factor IIF subunit 2 [Opisthocomus hoazin]
MGFFGVMLEDRTGHIERDRRSHRSPPPPSQSRTSRTGPTLALSPDSRHCHSVPAAIAAPGSPFQRFAALPPRECPLRKAKPRSSLFIHGKVDMARSGGAEKVPKYLSQQWNKASGRGEVGKLRIAKNQGRTEVSFTLNEELASISDIGGKPASVSAPREHPFLLQSVGGQTLTVFTETSVESQPEEKSESSSTDKLALEGIVVQRAECRPAASENYMKLKRLQIEESSKPVRLSQQLDKAVTTNYKPVANHQYNIEYEKKKKEDGKRARADKQQVLDMLFSAFEKHQYYNIKDLVDITKQPVIYLKEILREIGIYNVKGTHKNTWELKPEYRHYQGEDKSD